MLSFFLHQINEATFPEIQIFQSVKIAPFGIPLIGDIIPPVRGPQ